MLNLIFLDRQVLSISRQITAWVTQARQMLEGWPYHSTQPLVSADATAFKYCEACGARRPWLTLGGSRYRTQFRKSIKGTYVSPIANPYGGTLRCLSEESGSPRLGNKRGPGEYSELVLGLLPHPGIK